jgi:hypothetical protein
MPAGQMDGVGVDGQAVASVDTAQQMHDLQHELDTLRRALDTRTRIAVAVGLLAERYGCSSTQAWALLTRVSSHTNIKVREIARIVVAAADGTSSDQDAEALKQIDKHLPGLARSVTAASDEVTSVPS